SVGPPRLARTAASGPLAAVAGSPRSFGAASEVPSLRLEGLVRTVRESPTARAARRPGSHRSANSRGERPVQTGERTLRPDGSRFGAGLDGRLALWVPGHRAVKAPPIPAPV